MYASFSDRVSPPADVCVPRTGGARQRRQEERENKAKRAHLSSRSIRPDPGELARPTQGTFKVIDAEEQEQPVAGCRVVRAHQRRMVVRAPLMEAEQNGSIRIEDLSKV